MAFTRRALLERAVVLAGGLATGVVAPAAGARRPDHTDALRALLTRGGEVRLPAGVFRVTQTIEISRSVRLIGAGRGRTVLLHDGPGTRDTLVVRAAGVELAGLTIDARRADDQSGVYALMVRGARFTGRDLDVRGNGGAIFVRAHDSAWRDCTSPVWFLGATGCVVAGCRVDAERHPRLVLVSDGADRARIVANRFAGSARGDAKLPAIEVRASARAEVRDNEVLASRWHGIAVEDAPGVRVEGNTVRRPGRRRSDRGHSASGVLVVRAAGARVRRNAVSGCGGYGIAIAECRSRAARPLEVAANEIDGCEDPGLTVQASRAVVLAGNRVASATFGFTIGEDARPCSDVTVTGNSFERCGYGGGIVERSRNCTVRANVFLECGGDGPLVRVRP